MEEARANFRVRIRREGWELEVEAPDREYVDSKVEELLSFLTDHMPGSFPGGVTEPSKPVGLGEHVRKIAPNGGLEHVLAVGYYLEHHRSMKQGFRRRDLAAAFRTIKYQHSNPGVPIAAGRRQGLLLEGGDEERMRLSESAELWVRTRLAEELTPPGT